MPYKPHDMTTCDKSVCVEAKRIIREREQQRCQKAAPEQRRPQQLFGRPSPSYGRRP